MKKKKITYSCTGNMDAESRKDLSVGVKRQKYLKTLIYVSQF